MNNTFIAGLAGVILLTTPLAAANETLQGRWLSVDGRTLVDLAPCVDNTPLICATVIEDQPTQGEPSLTGQTIGRDFAHTGAGRWEGKVIASDGSALDSSLTMVSERELLLEVCLIFGLCDRDQFLRAP